MILVISRDLVRTIVEHARRAYPEECCGALLGHEPPGEGRAIVRVLPVANETAAERRTRYLIGPAEFRALDARARAEGLDVVGFYHSHPDHPAVPSEFDREHAWPWYAYVIVPVHGGRTGVPRAWRLAEDRSVFQELAIATRAVEPTRTKEAS